MKLFSRKSASIALVAATLLGGGGALMAANAGPWHHGGGMYGGGMMMGRGLDRMLDSVDATAEQRAQIKQISEAARADLQAQRESGAALREQARDLFVQPTVDPAAAEALRQHMLARVDQASQRTMQAMLDVSRVLTPEQRQTLAERMKERAEQHRQRGEQRPDAQNR